MNEVQKKEIKRAIQIMQKKIQENGIEIGTTNLEENTDNELAHKFKCLTRYFKKNNLKRPEHSYVSFELFQIIMKLVNTKPKKTSKENNSMAKGNYQEDFSFTRQKEDIEILKELQNFKKCHFTEEKNNTIPLFDSEKIQNLSPEKADRILALCLYFLLMKQTKAKNMDQVKKEKERNQKYITLLKKWKALQEKEFLFFMKLNGGKNVRIKREILTEKILNMFYQKLQTMSQFVNCNTPEYKIQQFYPFFRDFRNYITGYSQIEDWGTKTQEERFKDLEKVISHYTYHNEEDKKRNIRIS